MNVLHLFFVGLIAFAPGEQGEMRIFLLDGSSEVSFIGCKSHPHMPQLVVRRENVLGPCENEEVVSGIPVCTWSLAKVTISAHGLSSQGIEKALGKRKVGGSGEPLDYPTTADEATDISWLADMDDVTPDGGDMLQGIYSGQVDDGIAARLVLRDGKLQTCHIVEHLIKIDNKCVPVIPLFKFREKAQSVPRLYDQALADEIRLEARMDSHLLTIYREAFGGGFKPTITLQVLDGKPLDVLVVNLPPPLTHGQQCDRFAIDFARFFDLVRRETPGDKRRFIPQRQQNYVFAAGLQPDCGDSLVRSFLRAEDDDELCEGPDPAPYTRPICPMSFTEP
jgi:hypothetical protein